MLYVTRVSAIGLCDIDNNRDITISFRYRDNDIDLMIL